MNVSKLLPRARKCQHLVAASAKENGKCLSLSFLFSGEREKRRSLYIIPWPASEPFPAGRCVGPAGASVGSVYALVQAVLEEIRARAKRTVQPGVAGHTQQPGSRRDLGRFLLNPRLGV